MLRSSNIKHEVEILISHKEPLIDPSVRKNTVITLSSSVISKSEDHIVTSRTKEFFTFERKMQRRTIVEVFTKTLSMIRLWRESTKYQYISQHKTRYNLFEHYCKIPCLNSHE